MRDQLLHQICRLESWLAGPGRQWKVLPLRILGFCLLLCGLMISNLMAIIALPVTLLQRSKVRETQAILENPIAASDGDFDEKLREYPIVIADFWAPWCGPCLLMKPAIERLAEAGKGQYVVLTVNTAAQFELASRYTIQGLPTILVLREGKEVDRHVGAVDYAALLRFVESSLDQSTQ